MSKQNSGKEKQSKEELQMPFPETGYSPALQRTLKEKFDRGENPSVDRDKFFGSIKRSVKADPPCEQPDEE